MKPLSYIIVGSGYRSEYYAGIAAAYPGLRATVSLEEFDSFNADFAVIVVSKDSVM